MRHLKSFKESKEVERMEEERVDWYIKIASIKYTDKTASIKYTDKTADEIIEIIENGTEGLRFNSEREKELFKLKWEKK
jgi:hypothetical protein